MTQGGSRVRSKYTLYRCVVGGSAANPLHDAIPSSITCYLHQRRAPALPCHGVVVSCARIATGSAQVARREGRDASARLL